MEKLDHLKLGKFQFDDSIGHIVNRAAIILRKSLTVMFHRQGYDITPEEFAIMCILWEEDGLFQSEVTDRTLKDKTRVTRILSSLAKKSYIKKELYEADRRNHKILLTNEGKILREALLPLLTNLMGLASRNISEKDMAVTKKTLIQLFHNVNNGFYNNENTGFCEREEREK